jgi:two-component system copper resistance phosphate regulon response regulator CusR
MVTMRSMCRASFVNWLIRLRLIMRPDGTGATDEFLTFLSGVVGSVRRYTRGTVRILVVEDEQKVAKALREGLEAERYDVDVASTGEEGFFLVNHQSFDLVLLDLMLPRRDGIEVLTTLRRRGLQTPVLILTAKDTVDDRVYGLDSGADDYLVKPFAFSELLARIRALVRRDRSEQTLKLQQDNLEMDVVTRKVRRAGQVVELTVKEFEILEYLLRHRERVVSREMLARDVWHVTARATPLDNVIDVTIARLRRKIDDRFEPKLLHTVRGVGFVLGGARS